MSETASSALISLRTALIIVIIGVLSFSSLFVLLAFAPDLQDKNYAGPHAYSKSALGYNFSAELLKETRLQAHDPSRGGRIRDREKIIIPSDVDSKQS